MEMEVNVTKRVIKTVRGMGGKLVKKPVEVRKIVKKDKNIAVVKDAAVFLQHVTEMMLSIGSARMEVGVRSSLWSVL